MKPYEHQWYQSPIDLAARRVGNVEITHRIIPVGAKVAIVGLRAALLRNISPVAGRVEEPLRIHELREHGPKKNDVRLWMTDLPEELNQIKEMLYHVRPKKRVLVGGLGLGILGKALGMIEEVTNTVVIERSADIIKLCSAAGWYETHRADIKEFLLTTPSTFEYYLLDTWQGTGEATWWEDVLPLRRIIRQRHGAQPKIHCWAEDIMRGQMFRTLTHSPPHRYYSELPLPMSEADATYFLEGIGLPKWERLYGRAIDAALVHHS